MPTMSRSFNVRDTTSKREPSELVKASPLLMECYALGEDIDELERQARGAERLKEVYSSVPWYAQRAAKDPDYWNKFYGSRINW